MKTIKIKLHLSIIIAAWGLLFWQLPLLHAQQNDIVAQWKFSELENLIDSSPNGFNLTNINSVEFKSGKIGNAASFDGSGQHLRIADPGENSALDLRDKGSISVWIKVDAFSSGYDGIIHKGDNDNWTDEAFSLQFYGDKLRFYLAETDAKYASLDANKRIRKNRWYHVVAAWSPEGMNIYINGKLDNANSKSINVRHTTGGINIGSQLNDGSYPFDGLIDEVVIFNKALSYKEVENVYNNFVAPPVLEVAYVSVYGNNSNEGSAESPFETIQHAVNVLSPYGTIYVNPGTYYENIFIHSPMNLIGNNFGQNATILSMDSINAGIKIYNSEFSGGGGEYDYRITGFNINNSLIAGIYIEEEPGSILISGNRIYDNGIYGIKNLGASKVVISGNKFSTHITDIHLEGNASSILINYNDFDGEGMGVNNITSNSVDAENNWWGHYTGPRPNGPGQGDAISYNIDYDPWLKGPNLKVYEDAEDGLTTGWSQYTGAGEISNVFDSEKDSRVILLEGPGGYFNNGFKLVDFNNDVWNNANHKITWSMNLSEGYIIYIKVETNYGNGYIYYVPDNSDIGYNNWGGTHYIGHGLGKETVDNGWVTVTRNLQVDLSRYDQNLIIRHVQGFYIRGLGIIDDIKLEYAAPVEQVLIEDAEDGNAHEWGMYAGSGDSTYITNVYDSQKTSNVIYLNGPSGNTNDAFYLKHPSIHNYVNDLFSWSMKFSLDFVFYVYVETDQGVKGYLYYTPENRNRGLKEIGGLLYLHHGIGNLSYDGEWRTFTRNLELDLNDFYQGHKITRILEIRVRGAGYLDDIKFERRVFSWKPGLGKPSGGDTDPDFNPFADNAADHIINKSLNPYNPYTDLGSVTAIEDLTSGLPARFELGQNFPNPFNPETTIKFNLPSAEQVSIKIFSSTGQLIRSLITNSYAAGYHNILWNGRNDSGNKVTSGLYIYRIKAGKFISVKKMLMLK